MRGVLGRLLVWRLVAVFCVALVSVSSLNFGSAFALEQLSGQVVITGVVAPERYILLGPKGDITELISNTPQNVTPKVYLGNFKGLQLALTPAISRQYKSILATVKTSHAGIIYVRSNPTLASQLAERLINLNRFESAITDQFKLL